MTDFAHLVRRAGQGDVDAFVALTRRFQHLAFGSAMALVRDFQIAEDIVQEAFVSAWSALPKLAEPAAFPGWLRGIVRHHAFRVLRRRHLQTVPLAEASEEPSDAPAPDHVVEQRRRAAAALTAIAALPTRLREPAILSFVHGCSHQDIAVFLNLSATTVNNRLHAARMQLQQRIPSMVENMPTSQGLPDDFAYRIGRLVAARGGLIDALFDPASLPDLLAELLVSDEANKRAVTVQVVQRPGGGLVRGVANTPMDAVARGATVLNSGRPAGTPIYQLGFERIAPLLAGQMHATGEVGKLLETGIKVIDVMCPLVAGGTVAIAGEVGAGLTVVMEELVRRLSGGSEPVSLFVLMPPASPLWPDSLSEGFTLAGSLQREGYSEGTVGAVQSFFLRGQEEPWTAEHLAAFDAADVVIHLSREVATAKIYPAVDTRTSRSRLLRTGIADRAHVAIAEQVRQTLAALPWGNTGEAAVAVDPVVAGRARKLMNFFAQPFFVAEPYTKRPGSYVALRDSLRGCEEILAGQHDDLPADACYFSGTIEEIRAARRT